MDITYSHGDITNVCTVNEEGRLGVVQHSHINSMDVHLHNDVAATTSWIAIDISDDRYTDGSGNNYVHLENMYVDIDSDVNGDYEVVVGYLKEVGATQGSFVHLYSLSGTKKAGNSKTQIFDLYPNGAKMDNGYVLTNDVLTSSDYGTASTLTSTLGDTIIPDNGDVVVRAVMNAGTINLAVNLSYHTH